MLVGVPARGPSRLARAVIAADTAILVLGVGVALFMNPIWIAIGQERAGVPAITGFTSEQVRTVTSAILADLFFGPPAFDVTVAGSPVLGPAERGHMVDVRHLLLALLALLGLAALSLAVVLARHHRSAPAWRAVSLGAAGLAIAGIIAGVAIFFFFDTAFELFHRVFFPQGNFSFDPRTQRLTQLFPERFFTETASGIAVTGLALAVAVALLARRRAVRLRR